MTELLTWLLVLAIVLQGISMMFIAFQMSRLRRQVDALEAKATRLK
jgi:hypothetical protein